MIEGAIRTVAIVASLLVAIGFILFAVDELSGASQRQQAAILDPGAQQEQNRERRHSGARELIDDANDQLLKPFADVVPSSNRWVQRGVPTLLALLVYGVGLGFLARYVRSRA